MPDELPVDYSDYGEEALKPYLELHGFMHKETWSRAKTVCYVRKAESPEKNRALGLLCLQFRNGIVIFKAEVWECYEGEGLEGLDERWDIGTAIFPNGVDKSTVSNVLRYVGESEQALTAGGQFTDLLRQLEGLYVKYVKALEKEFQEPPQET